MGRTVKNIIRSCLPLIVVAVVLVIVLSSIGNLSAGSREEEKQHLEDALRRAAISCYASEGFYPPDVEYIKTHYGVQVDDRDFRVFYEVFAENMMPDIDVVVRNEQK